MTTSATPPARVRMTPEGRREQLLDLGVRLLASRSLDELSIDLLAEEAGISRGLLYHYFGNKHDFHEAVVRRAADDLIATTAPVEGGPLLERLRRSMGAYVDYVVENELGYVSLVKGAASGSEALRTIYEEARSSLTDRIFRTDVEGDLVEDTPATRMVVRGWSAYAEEVVLTWLRDPAGLTRDQVIDVLTDALPALLTTVPCQQD